MIDSTLHYAGVGVHPSTYPEVQRELALEERRRPLLAKMVELATPETVEAHAAALATCDQRLEWLRELGAELHAGQRRAETSPAGWDGLAREALSWFTPFPWWKSR